MAESGRGTRTGSLWLIAGVLGLSLALLAASFCLNVLAVGAWWADALTNIGAALLLIIPIWLITHSLDAGIQKARSEIQESREEANAQVRDAEQRVSGIEQEVSRRLDDVEQRLKAQLDARRDTLLERLASLTVEPNRSALLAAMRDALERGLICPELPPRVTVTERSDHTVTVVYAPNDWPQSELGFIVSNGQQTEYLPWDDSTGVDDIALQLAQAVERLGGYHGDFSVGLLFRRLEVMLKAAMSLAERRPVVAVSEPQWLITTNAIVSYSATPNYPYAIRRDRIADADFVNHVRSKTWCNCNSLDIALGEADVIFRSPSENEPPF